MSTSTLQVAGRPSRLVDGLLDQFRDSRHIHLESPSLERALNTLHDGAQRRLAVGARSLDLVDRTVDELDDLGLGDLLDAAVLDVVLQHLGLGFLLLGEVLALGGAGLLGGVEVGAHVAAQQGDELGVGGDGAVGLGGVVGRRYDGAEDGEALGVFGAHGRLEVGLEGREKGGRRGCCVGGGAEGGGDMVGAAGGLEADRTEGLSPAEGEARGHDGLLWWWR
ncbi:hypothetical protein BN1708_001071 [Verticillium longisporum]|uniref:Uncharacterized protein n=1 Tax=Verticillium longisporum TaxID=100787 RepID=A0A0G4MGI6_VERLO|nr:hypothetical protein BN1708_001071 [Verticillium longisporum]